MMIFSNSNKYIKFSKAINLIVELAYISYFKGIDFILYSDLKNKIISSASKKKLF